MGILQSWHRAREEASTGRLLAAAYAYEKQTSGLTPRDARQRANGILRYARALLRSGAMPRIPPRLGETLLEVEALDLPQDFVEQTRESLRLRREDGVRDDDILWYYGLSDIERAWMIAEDRVGGLAVFKAMREQGLSEDEAGGVIRRGLVHFYVLDSHAKSPPEDDGPLPMELRNRIFAYMGGLPLGTPGGPQASLEMAQLLSEIADGNSAYSSLNAFVRSRIRAGEL